VGHDVHEQVGHAHRLPRALAAALRIGLGGHELQLALRVHVGVLVATPELVALVQLRQQGLHPLFGARHAVLDVARDLLLFWQHGVLGERAL
jgi:hypothetical protein